MQDREPSTFESIWSGNVVGGQRPEQPARLWNFLTPDRGEVLVVREPFGDRARTALLVTAALVASFGLGWAGGLNWPQFASELGLVEVAQNETPSPRISEARSSGRMRRHAKDGIRVKFARHCRKHSQAIRPAARRCTPVCEPGLPGKCGPFRRCARDAAAGGGAAGNQAGDDSRLDGCRCSGRHRRSRRS